MQQLEDTRPEIPAIGADARDEIVSMARAAHFVSARRVRRRAAVVAGAGLGALALTAGTLVATGTFSLGPSSDGLAMWTGTVPSGLTCVSSISVMGADAEFGIADADLEPFQTALADIASAGLSVDDAAIADLVGSPDAHMPFGGLVAGEELLAAHEVASFEAVSRDDGSGIYDLVPSGEPPAITTGDGITTVSSASDEDAATTVGYFAVSEDGSTFGATVRVDGTVPAFWSIAESGGALILREATDDELAAKAAELFGTSALTRDDLTYLAATSAAVDRALRDQLTARGLGYISVDGGMGFLDPLQGGWDWTCG